MRSGQTFSSLELDGRHAQYLTGYPVNDLRGNSAITVLRFQLLHISHEKYKEKRETDIGNIVEACELLSVNTLLSDVFLVYVKYRRLFLMFFYLMPYWRLMYYPN